MTTDMSGRTQQAKEEGRRVTDEARSKGQQVGRQAREEMGHVLDDARSRARHQADEQTHRAAGGLRVLADQLHSMAEGADQEGMMIDLAENGSERIRRFADQLDEGGIDRIVDDVQDFARRRPGVFIAAGMAVGMLLGRLLKASDTGAMRQALTDNGGEETSRARPELESEDIDRRSESLVSEEPARPVTTRPEGPETGRGV